MINPGKAAGQEICKFPAGFRFRIFYIIEKKTGLFVRNNTVFCYGNDCIFHIE